MSVEKESDKDHIHLLIDCKPQEDIANIVKAFKGLLTRFLIKKHPKLKNSFGLDIYGVQATL